MFLLSTFFSLSSKSFSFSSFSFFSISIGSSTSSLPSAKFSSSFSSTFFDNSSLNFSSTLPGLLTEAQDLDFSLFIDAANVWGVDYSSTIDDNSKIRSSTGIALDWFTPIGPFNFTLSENITKADTDITESFRFNIGTTF